MSRLPHDQICAKMQFWTPYSIQINHTFLNATLLEKCFSAEGLHAKKGDGQSTMDLTSAMRMLRPLIALKSSIVLNV